MLGQTTAVTTEQSEHSILPYHCDSCGAGPFESAAEYADSSNHGPDDADDSSTGGAVA